MTRHESAPTDTVPDDAPKCEHCGDAFPDDRLLALHRGLDHYDSLNDDEREAFEDAYRDEERDLRSFRLRAIGVLVALYFGFLMVYAVVTL